MVVPQPLGLTPASEDLLKENMEVFQRNGFEFQFDEGQVRGKWGDPGLGKSFSKSIFLSYLPVKVFIFLITCFVGVC